MESGGGGELRFPGSLATVCRGHSPISNICQASSYFVFSLKQGLRQGLIFRGFFFFDAISRGLHRGAGGETEKDKPFGCVIELSLMWA